MKKHIVIFISGGGSNMVSLIKASLEHDFPAKVVAVISDNDKADGINKAKDFGIDTHCVLRKDYASKASFEDAILAILQQYKPDYICLAGFMRLISSKIISPYENRILNIHPSLLPLFKGLDTHEKAINAAMKVSGCTVHLVTEGMDEGEILGQAVVPILKDDTKESLAARVLKVEHQLYPKVLRAIIEGNSASIDEKQQILSY